MTARRTMVIPLLIAAAALTARTPAGSQRPTRERISLDEGWRFTKGDPPGNSVSLLYDVRPEVPDQRDDRPADAQPTAAGRAGPRRSGCGEVVDSPQRQRLH